jgi:hypothetical protein
MEFSCWMNADFGWGQKYVLLPRSSLATALVFIKLTFSIINLKREFKCLKLPFAVGSTKEQGVV